MANLIPPSFVGTLRNGSRLQLSKCASPSFFIELGSNLALTTMSLGMTPCWRRTSLSRFLEAMALPPGCAGERTRPCKLLLVCGIQSPTEAWFQCFLAIDKNLHRHAIETSTKGLGNLLVAILKPRGLAVTTHRPEGIVFVDQAPLARLDPKVDSTLVVHWNPELLAKFMLNKEALMTQMEQASSSNSLKAKLEQVQ